MTAHTIVDGVRIAYERHGVGAPVILFHGAFEDSRSSAPEVERLRSRAEVIAWDAPGCGSSADIPEGWDESDWADTAAGFIDALGVTRPIVVGFSFGSVLALLLARDHPGSVGGLLLVGAYPGWGGALTPDVVAERVAAARFTMEHPANEWADAFLDSVFAPESRVDDRERARAILDDWRPATTAAFLSLIVNDYRPGLSKVSTPTLVVRGSDDSRSPRSATAELCRLLQRARSVEIAGAGHDCRGRELDALILDLAARVHAGRLL